MLMYVNDILYSQGDTAEDVFFIYKGSVLLYVDLTDLVDMTSYQLLDATRCFNVAVALFSSSSYFGDNDVLLHTNGWRSHTAICQEETHIHTIHRDTLMECLENYPDVQETMTTIAKEKQRRFSVLNEELAAKCYTKRQVR